MTLSDSLLDHLNTTKALLENATAATGLVGGITTAIEAAQKLFP